MGCANSKPNVKFDDSWANNPPPLEPARPKGDVTLKQVADCSDVDTASELEQETAPPPPPPPSFFSTNLAWANSVWTAPAMNVVEEDEPEPTPVVSHSRSASDASSVAAGGPNPFSSQEPEEEEELPENYLATQVNYSNMLWKHAIKKPDAYVPISKPAGAASVKSKVAGKPAPVSKSDVAQVRDVQAKKNGPAQPRSAPPVANGHPAPSQPQSSAFADAKKAGQKPGNTPNQSTTQQPKPAAPNAPPAKPPSLRELKAQQSATRGGPPMKSMQSQQQPAKPQQQQPAKVQQQPAQTAAPTVVPNSVKPASAFGGPSLLELKQQQTAARGGPSMKDLRAQQQAARQPGMQQHQQQPNTHFHSNRPVAVAAGF